MTSVLKIIGKTLSVCALGALTGIFAKHAMMSAKDRRFGDAQFDSALRGKFVVVTGGTSGLGESFAKLSKQYGANVLVVGRNVEQENLAKEAAYVRADLSRTSGIEKAIDQINRWAAEFAPDKTIDYMFLNAGIGFHGEYTDITLESATSLMTLNAIAPIAMAAQIKSRHIINISSPQGVISCMPHRSLYVASKHALHGFSKALTADGVPNVTSAYPMWIKTNLRKNSIKAGSEDSESQNHKRAAEPDDVAKIITRDAILGRDNSMLTPKIQLVRVMSVILPSLTEKLVKKQFEGGKIKSSKN